MTAFLRCSVSSFHRCDIPGDALDFRKQLCASVECRVEAKTLNSDGKLVLGGLAPMVAVLLTASSLGKDLGLPTCLAALGITALVSAKARSNPIGLAREISWETLALVAVWPTT